MITRRQLIAAAGGGAVVAGAGLSLPERFEAQAQGLNLPAALPEGVRANVVMDALPGKKPLIKLSYRPPNYETPIEYFRSIITSNDAFFVRYHLSVIPQVDASTWTLGVGGDGANGEARFTLNELKQFTPVELVALCQCSGNRRGLFRPHVPGVEWGYGAMGCARCTGVRLKDLLDKVGIKKESIEIVVAGTDGGISENVPKFVKSIPLWKGVEDTTLIAYEMNGEPLPHWNGFPARLIVPGWTGTYWMKHLSSIAVTTKPFDGFWMKSAYRIPTGKFPVVARFISQETAVNTPITEMVTNSLITSHADGEMVRAGSNVIISGIAWDGGFGINGVDVSVNAGKSWAPAALGQDLGRFAFRPWSYRFSPAMRGKTVVMARATNMIGQSQTTDLIQNPAGYHHNVVQAVTLVVS